MPTIRKQYFGIKFPFNSDNLNGFFLDLNLDLKDKVVSEIAHVILTPKGSRLRKPDFGTNLAKFIFDQNDDASWEQVKKEAVEAVGKYVKDAELEDLKVVNENNSLFLDMYYKIKKGMKEENNRVVIKL